MTKLNKDFSNNIFSQKSNISNNETVHVKRKIVSCLKLMAAENVFNNVNLY